MKIPFGLAQHALTLKQSQPTILFVGGVVGAVGSTVLACRSTLKLEGVLEDIQDDLDLARNMPENLEELKNDPETAERYKDKEYTVEDSKKDIAVIYVKGAVKVGKLYAPAIGLGVVSIALLTKSHMMLTHRNTALTAAYVALDKGFTAYRENVIEKYGEDVDREMRFPREKVKEPNPETGREHTVEKVKPFVPGGSIYARFFDESCAPFQPEPEYNLAFLMNQQNYMNDRLRMRKHLFLNEVYDALGMERSKAGAVVGWTLGQNSDNYVDFGIFDGENGMTRAFVNGHEGAILLDFNVDGVIIENLPDIVGLNEVNQ